MRHFVLGFFWLSAYIHRYKKKCRLNPEIYYLFLSHISILLKYFMIVCAFVLWWWVFLVCGFCVVLFSGVFLALIWFLWHHLSTSNIEASSGLQQACTACVSILSSYKQQFHLLLSSKKLKAASSYLLGSDWILKYLWYHHAFMTLC